MKMNLNEEKTQLENSLIFLDGVLGIGVVLDPLGKEVVEVSVADETAKKIAHLKIESDFLHLVDCLIVVIATPTEFQ